MENKIWLGFGIFGKFCLGTVLILASRFFLSLGKRAYYSSETALKAPFSLPGTKEETLSSIQLQTPPRLIIKTATLNIVVKNVTETAKKIIQ